MAFRGSGQGIAHLQEVHFQVVDDRIDTDQVRWGVENAGEPVDDVLTLRWSIRAVMEIRRVRRRLP